jgi:hypothetical protein
MVIETIFLNFPSGQRLKLTFRENFTNEGKYFLVNIADMELNCLKNLTAFEKNYHLGVQIYKERIKSCNPQNYEDLKTSILNRYKDELCL